MGDEPEPALVEFEEPEACGDAIVTCFVVDGLSHAECYRVYRDCLVDHGWDASDPLIGCFDQLITCSEGTPFASDRSEHQLACSEALWECVPTPGYYL